jgi:hypothetical protein
MEREVIDHDSHLVEEHVSDVDDVFNVRNIDMLSGAEAVNGSCYGDERIWATPVSELVRVREKDGQKLEADKVVEGFCTVLGDRVVVVCQIRMSLMPISSVQIPGAVVDSVKNVGFVVSYVKDARDNADLCKSE